MQGGSVDHTRHLPCFEMVDRPDLNYRHPSTSGATGSVPVAALWMPTSGRSLRIVDRDLHPVPDRMVRRCAAVRSTGVRRAALCY